MDVEATVRQAILIHALFAPRETLVVGVSGGADSLCLLDVLRGLPADLAAHVHVAHLNHGLRGEAAAADARFVAQTAAAWDLPCTVGEADVAADAQRAGISAEEAGRRARYTFLGDVARATGARRVAVAHHADDQVETILMHFLRGSGLAGLRGMLPVSPLPCAPWGRAVVETAVARPAAEPQSLLLVRPLLEVDRVAIDAYCRNRGLDPRVDPSNADTTFFRNRLRHELLPYLETYNSGLREVVLRMAQVVADEHDLLRSLLAEVWPEVVRRATLTRVTIELDAWRGQAVAMQRSILREAIHHLRPGLRDVGFAHVERGRAFLADPSRSTGQQTTLPQGLLLTMGYTTATIAGAGRQPDDAAGPQLFEAPLTVGTAGVTRLPHTTWYLHADIRAQSELPADWQTNRDRWRAYLDADAVGPEPFLRTRRPREGFQPLGLEGHRSLLNDFMINHKLPAPLRGAWPLLEGRDGLVWLVGLRIDERARVRPATQRVLCLQMAREETWDESLDLLGA